MTRWIERASIALLVIACTLVIRAIIRARRHRRSGLCPGPFTPIRDYLFPWAWFASACLYDLRATPSHSDGTVTCPECGLRSRPASHPRLPAGRTCVLAAILILTASAGLSFRWIRRGEWAQYTPTPLLNITVNRLRSVAPSRAREELSTRLEQSALSTSQRRELAITAIANLGSDNVKGNADWAMWTLHNLADDALPFLEEALTSVDYQRRQYAAAILREHWDSTQDPWYGPVRPRLPSASLLKVTVEGLADDRGRFPSWFGNANDGVIFLARVGPAAAPFLKPALHSSDAQQRNLAAIAAGLIGDPSLIEDAMPVLLRQLDRNGGEGDARCAARAIYCFGPAVLPFVRPLCHSPDKQKANLARLIAMDLETPNQPIEVRRRLNTVTNFVHDPATDLTLHHIREMLR